MGKHLSNLVIIIYTASMVAAFSACTKEQEADTIAPVIDMVLPLEGDTLFINEDTHVEINISDERELDSCRFEVYANLNNLSQKSFLIGSSMHDATLHDSTLHGSTLNGDVPWSYSRTFILTGIKSTTLHDYAFIVPDSVGNNPIAQGAYLFEVNCWDKAGNHSSVLLHIIITARY